MVGVEEAAVEAELAAGRLACPGCDGVLAPWGWRGGAPFEVVTASGGCARVVRGAAPVR